MTKIAPTDREVLLEERKRRGIPTLIDGVRYRSRTEARWGEFFKRLAWPSEHEPVDLTRYIPDFVINFEAGPLLVEVKPDTQLDTLRVYADKIVRSGWQHEFLIVGSTMHPSAFGGEHGPVFGLLAERQPNGEALLGPAQVFFCLNCNLTSLLHVDGSWHCRACGASDGNAHIGEGSIPAIQGIWANATTRVQWKPEGWPST